MRGEVSSATEVVFRHSAACSRDAFSQEVDTRKPQSLELLRLWEFEGGGDYLLSRLRRPTRDAMPTNVRSAVLPESGTP